MSVEDVRLLGKDNLCKFVVIRWAGIYATLISVFPVVDDAVVFTLYEIRKKQKRTRKKKGNKRANTAVYLYICIKKLFISSVVLSE